MKLEAPGVHHLGRSLRPEEKFGVELMMTAKKSKQTEQTVVKYRGGKCAGKEITE